MGKLRIEPKHTKPDFIRLVLDPTEQPQAPSRPREDTSSNITIRTRRGTEISVGRSVPLKQVARLVKILETRGPHDLG